MTGWVNIRWVIVRVDNCPTDSIRTYLLVAIYSAGFTESVYWQRKSCVDCVNVQADMGLRFRHIMVWHT